MKRSTVSLLFCAAAAAFTLPAAAQTLPAPHQVLGLSASASVEVPQDLISVTVSATREGADPVVVQRELKQALDAALAEAKRHARPGELDVRTGLFSVHPRYGDKGLIRGWVGSAELTLEGRDMPAIARLSGSLPTMTVARVGYGLSREAREKAEADVTAQAIGRYRAKAAEMSRLFGFGSHTIREVHVSTGEPPMPMAMMRERAMDAAAAMPLPVEPGRGSVSVTVSGSVQMQ